MKRHLWPAALAALSATLWLADARAACYSVYRPQGLVFRSIQVPVDLSRQLHETVPARFGPGASMVIAESADGCRDVDERPRDATSSAQVASRRSAANRRADRTAERYIEQRAEPIDSEVGVTSTGAEPSPATLRRIARPAL